MTQQERLIYLVKGLVKEYTEKYKTNILKSLMMKQNSLHCLGLFVIFALQDLCQQSG